MLVLFETAAGYALLKVLDEGKVSKVDNIFKEFVTPSAATSLLSLQNFHKFDNTTEALEACTALVESKLGKGLRTFLKENVVSKGVTDQLAVADAKLAGAIKEKLGIPCVSGSNIQELHRCIRGQLAALLTEVTPQDMNTMSLGLAHSYSRYKVKFSPDKVDTMIVQAIALLDDLDKEINTYAMRVREWYGWHFPEMGKIVADNLTYSKIILAMGSRTNSSASLAEIVPEELEKEIKEAAQVSMGTEVSEEDMSNIAELCTQVVDITNYREQLWEYLKNRMQAIAPNLTTLVGELVGARLIAHTGSLLSLAKHPASTIQILGAEKALFRALKAKKKTPKYGLIYHASLIGQTPAKSKGQISRVLAAKAALCARVDALGEATLVSIGLEGRNTVEARMRKLEERGSKISGVRKTPTPKYDKGSSLLKQTPTYNKNKDVQLAATTTTTTTTTTTPTKSPIKKVIGQKRKQQAPPEEPEAEAEVAPEAEQPLKRRKTTKKEEAPAEMEPEVEAAAAPAKTASAKKKKVVKKTAATPK